MAEAGFEARLQELGQVADADLPLTEVLLLMGALDSAVADIFQYQQHLRELRLALQQEIDAHPAENIANILSWRLDRLNAVLRSKFEYHADHEGYDEPENINLLTVIDRRCGIPVALGALYMDLAASQDWMIVGLNFPGHFFLRLEDGARQLIFDPFEAGEEMNAGKLRTILKKVLGNKAELHHDYYNAVTKREVALRFYNNRKTRLINRERYEEALTITTWELWVAPDEPRLYYDAGILAAKIDHVRDAIDYLSEFTQRSHDVRTVSEARDMIRGLQRLLQ